MVNCRNARESICKQQLVARCSFRISALSLEAFFPREFSHLTAKKDAMNGSSILWQRTIFSDLAL